MSCLQETKGSSLELRGEGVSLGCREKWELESTSQVMDLHSELTFHPGVLAIAKAELKGPPF